MSKLPIPSPAWHYWVWNVHCRNVSSDVRIPLGQDPTILTNKNHWNKLAIMRGIVAKTLIFFILFANLAWAADMDEVGVVHDSAKLLVISDAPEDPIDNGHNNDPCDHCCHGTAHYVGLPHKTTPTFTDNTSCVPSPQLAAYLGRDLDPPVPPPNI